MNISYYERMSLKNINFSTIPAHNLNFRNESTWKCIQRKMVLQTLILSIAALQHNLAEYLYLWNLFSFSYFYLLACLRYGYILSPQLYGQKAQFICMHIWSIAKYIVVYFICTPTNWVKHKTLRSARLKLFLLYNFCLS